MAIQIPTKSWWETEQYTDSTIIPAAFSELAGPSGVALVKAYDDGRTQVGWGLNPPKDSNEGFMSRYLKTEFVAQRALYRYENKGAPFAFVMRSMRIMCVDIDGKNGGLEYAGRLGALPITLAETSKSGNGYHLFYSTDEEWDSETGFGLIPDQIGITQGVDIRGAGCVYHHDTQRWNGRPIAPLPEWLRDRLLEKQQRREASKAAMQKISTLDEMEQLMAHSELLDELAKPIPAGKRNTTLFAIGAKLMQAGVPDWEKHVTERGAQINLPFDEVEKIVSNIENYGASV